MIENQKSKTYDLEKRTLEFAQRMRNFIKRLPKTLANQEDGKQLIRSSGSTGANYIEANETLGKKDFLMKIKTCRKEAKESTYWLRLVDVEGKILLENERTTILDESVELTKIFGSIVRKIEPWGF